MAPTLTVLVYSAVAAGAAALGAIPAALRRPLSLRWLGWANALAAGLMLGAAYRLMMIGLERGPLTSWASPSSSRPTGRLARMISS
ncbi:MAG TPA: hypothetical protein VNI61_12655 [Gemmatimonadales bacterium]|nr:hypothetical protein [Gemmatimonadales bacterium]